MPDFPEEDGLLNEIGGLIAELAPMKQICQTVKDQFYNSQQERRSEFLSALTRARDTEFARLLAAPMQLNEPPLVLLRDELLAYAIRCDWSLLDLAALAVAIYADDKALIHELIPCLLTYQAFRMIDDVLDGHIDYKGGFLTALGRFRALPNLSDAAIDANLLPGLMMLHSATPQLTHGEHVAVQRILWGALIESIGRVVSWTPESYRCMVDGKMVQYGLLLYGRVANRCAHESQRALRQFLQRSFYVSQLINDLYDRADDLLRGQANWWNIKSALNDQSAELRCGFDELFAQANELEPQAGTYARSRLVDLIVYLEQALDKSFQENAA